VGGGTNPNGTGVIAKGQGAAGADYEILVRYVSITGCTGVEGKGIDGWVRAGSTLEIESSVVMGNGIDIDDEAGASPGTILVNRTATSDGTADDWGGTNPQPNETIGDWFEDVANDDLRLKAAKQGGGLDLGDQAEKFTLNGRDADADGGAWDQGAWQHDVPVGGSVAVHFLHLARLRVGI
jgi:hypothetical protein